MIRFVLLITFFTSGSSCAQQLWGSLTSGKHPVGFRVIREHDRSRDNRPMLVSLWYPAKPSSSATTVLFKDYLASGVINSSFTPPTESEKTSAYDDFHHTMERPFIANAEIPDTRFNILLELPTAAKWNLAEADGNFPAVLMSTEPESLSVTAEYLASNGFVVAAVNAPYGGEQPPDSLLWIQPTKDMQWLLEYTKNLKNVDQSGINVMGFGGGIQSAFFLSMKSDVIRSIVNLEGGVFGPRSLTDRSRDYHPEKITAPMLHIVTTDQQGEDDVRQQKALVNTLLYKALIQHEGLHHHDFSIYGRALNKGVKMRGALGDIADQTYATVHRMILEFLVNTHSFTTTEKYMPFVRIAR